MKRVLIAMILVLAPLAVCADVLLIEEVRQVDKMDVPENGLSKAEVETMFGSPAERHSAVGNPPISRWDYPDYSVYFEYDLVLFTVLRPGEVIDQTL